jgi:hypothetical protein
MFISLKTTTGHGRPQDAGTETNPHATAAAAAQESTHGD